ncbi:arylamine N-acetyltransferase family protein [Streptomyces otsuchiensis]|uniref:arylamine N-acetyltransferase family protein n=1 Tax=Streptomyces otsuchiensis TaxID=2681388 RepID=UPI001300201C|nr:arylamine N-acetyltransferase [Streptomyces otsuchiensis]
MAKDKGWQVPTDAYLRRLEYDGVVEPGADCLRALSEAHLRAVPYEMLDALDGRAPSLDLPAVFAKLVDRRGGGTCLESTPLFGHFLRQCGFSLKLVAAQAWRVAGTWAPRWDHLLLVVEAEGAEWLVDVSFLMLTVLRPLRIDSRPQEHAGWTYRVARVDGHRVVLRRTPDGDWAPVYRFADRSLRLDDYTWIVGHHMADDDSPLTGSLLCSRGVEGGKLILMRDNFVRAEHGREYVEFLSNTTEAEKALGEILRGHEHLTETALRSWERTRRSRRRVLPGIG